MTFFMSYLLFLFFLVFYFTFLLELLFHFSLWTFISLIYLDFYFHFLFALLFPTAILFKFVFNSIAVTHLGFFFDKYGKRDFYYLQSKRKGQIGTHEILLEP